MKRRESDSFLMLFLKLRGGINVYYKNNILPLCPIYIYYKYLQPIITQYFIDNKSEIWLLFLIAHSKR